jgi:hypothetical protein
MDPFLMGFVSQDPDRQIEIWKKKLCLEELYLLSGELEAYLNFLSDKKFVHFLDVEVPLINYIIR